MTGLPSAEESAAELVINEAVVREFMQNLGIAADRFDEVEAGLRQLAFLVESEVMLRVATKVVEDPLAKKMGAVPAHDFGTWLVEASKRASDTAGHAGEMWSLVHLVGAFGRANRGRR